MDIFTLVPSISSFLLHLLCSQLLKFMLSYSLAISYIKAYIYKYNLVSSLSVAQLNMFLPDCLELYNLSGGLILENIVYLSLSNH